ncbi:MAG: deoxyribose-phosphate aldolase [Bacteriovoracaceae bacterium]|nr:deoxyribose-phosphate aldolase [Bacteriovoracaceae bacterium]
MKKINQYIDHTLLKPDAIQAQIQKLCEEAIEHHFYAVCVQPYYVRFCKKLLSKSSVKVCTVIGFPLGANHPEIKKAETLQALADGADEIDMVLNIGELKAGHDQNVLSDIQKVVNATHQGKKICKVIIETSLLNTDEKIRACRLVSEAKADFIKTSTGFSGGGATVADIELFKKNVSSEVKIKASGGVKTYADAIAMIEAGASRLGTSSGIALTQGQTASGSY